MWKSDTTGGGGSSTCAVTAEDTPLAAMAEISVVPAALPVTTPVALTAATEGLALDQVIGAPPIGTPFSSNAAADSATFSPTSMVRLSGVTMMNAISPGGGVS